jgi:peptidoglycan hydrolase-like protein with peptidoglycan-binding domain
LYGPSRETQEYPVSRTLYQGCTGTDVRNLQLVLNLQRGPHDQRIGEDGIFGPETRARVKAFQTYAKLKPDGIVGPLTFAALVPVGTHTTQALVKPGNAAGSKATPSSRVAQVVDPEDPLNPSPPPVPPAVPTGPWDFKFYSQFQLLAGQQLSFKPNVYSPLVVTAQYNLIMRHPGSADLTAAVGGQFALNADGESGDWTGQGFGQVGLAFNKKFHGIDFLNPSLVLMLSRNQGQAATWSIGAADQMNYQLDEDGHMNLFLNGQVVWGLDFARGDATGPGLQILGGISFTLGQMPPDPGAKQ